MKTKLQKHFYDAAIYGKRACSTCLSKTEDKAVSIFQDEDMKIFAKRYLRGAFYSAVTFSIIKQSAKAIELFID